MLIASACLAPLHASMPDETPVDAAELEHEYQILEQQLAELQRESSLEEKSLAIVIPVIIDLALELTHAINVMHSSPDYFYQAPITGPADLRHIWRDIFYRTLSTGYRSGIAAGLISWFSSYGSALPSLSSRNLLWQLGTITGAMAAIYGLLNGRMAHQGSTTNPFTLSDTASPLLSNLQPEAKPWFLAAASLDQGKWLLQAAAATTMVCWSFMQRFHKQEEIGQLRDSLLLARSGMRRAWQNARPGGNGEDKESMREGDADSELTRILGQLTGPEANLRSLSQPSDSAAEHSD